MSQCLNLTQGCKSYHPTKCIYYSGVPLSNSNINTNDSLDLVIAKLNSAILNSSKLIGLDKTYYGTNFTNSTQLNDISLKGKRFRLAMRGFDKLIYFTEWQYIFTGGFTIMLSSFAVSPTDIFHLEFY